MRLIPYNYKLKAVSATNLTTSTNKLQIGNIIHINLPPHFHDEEVICDKSKLLSSDIRFYVFSIFYKYQARICTVNSDWYKRKYLGGEHIFLYVLDASKPKELAIFNTPLLDNLYLQINRLLTSMPPKYEDIHTKVERANYLSSRIKPIDKLEV